MKKSQALENDPSDDMKSNCQTSENEAGEMVLEQDIKALTKVISVNKKSNS